MGAFQSLHASLWVIIPKEVNIKKKTSLGVSPGPDNYRTRSPSCCHLHTREFCQSMLFFASLIWAASCHRETRFSWQGDVLSCLVCIYKSFKNCFFNFIFFFYHMGKLTFVGCTVPKIHNTTTTIRYRTVPSFSPPLQNKSSLLYPFTGIPCLCPKSLACTDILHHYSFLPFKEMSYKWNHRVHTLWD